MRFNTLHHIHKMLQNCSRKSFLNTQNPGASATPRAPYQGFALDSLETLGGPQAPRRLSSPLTQNPGSAPGKDRFNSGGGLLIDFKDYIYLVNVFMYTASFV